jgi:hypothetical protein
MKNPILFNLFLLIKLPLAFFAGLKLIKLEKDICEVSLPYGWRTQNPFKSIYFAAQCMAAELSTGALAKMAVDGSGKKISMLVAGMEAEFLKKADKKVFFVCNEGQKIFDAVAHTSQTGEAITVKVKSTGTTIDGIKAAEFYFTWSFKRKS